MIYKRTDVNEANSHSESVQEQTTAIKVAPICDRDTIGWSELIDGTQVSLACAISKKKTIFLRLSLSLSYSLTFSFYFFLSLARAPLYFSFLTLFLKSSFFLLSLPCFVYSASNIIHYVYYYYLLKSLTTHTHMSMHSQVVVKKGKNSAPFFPSFSFFSSSSFSPFFSFNYLACITSTRKKLKASLILYFFTLSLLSSKKGKEKMLKLVRNAFGDEEKKLSFASNPSHFYFITERFHVICILWTQQRYHLRSFFSCLYLSSLMLMLSRTKIS